MKKKMNLKRILGAILSVAMIVGLLSAARIEAQASDDRLIFSVLGDSISSYYGYEEYPYYGPDYLCDSITYIINKEDMWWSKYSRDKKFRFGWSSSIIASMVTDNDGSLLSLNNESRINNLSKNGVPDVIAVYGGVNDHVLAGADRERFYNRYDALISRLHGKYPNALLICITPYHLQNGDFSMYDNTVLDSYAESIRNIAAKYGDYYVDLRTISFEASDFDVDGSLHPNESGHTKIAQKIEEVVTDNLFEKSISKREKKSIDTGVWIFNDSAYNIQAGLVSYVDDINKYDYQWMCYDCRNKEWIMISDWTNGVPWLNWKPTRGGDLWLYGRIKPHNSGVIVGGSCVAIHNDIISGTCQMPNPNWGGGWLIGISTYDNPNNSYRYELCVLDCNRYVNGDPNPWVYTTGKMNTGGGNTAWTIWQPQHGYYWTLFRIYDSSGNLLDEKCFGAVA